MRGIAAEQVNEASADLARGAGCGEGCGGNVKFETHESSPTTLRVYAHELSQHGIRFFYCKHFVALLLFSGGCICPGGRCVKKSYIYIVIYLGFGIIGNT